MQLQVFCDEFGNTGANLFDPTQPVLVYAFFVIEPARLADIVSQLHELYRRERIELRELKSGQLLTSSRGRRRYEAIGRIVANFGARVLFSIVEKRYQVCAMIVESYLDPHMHEFAPPEMADRRFRQRFTDACYDSLRDDALAQFLSAQGALPQQKCYRIGSLPHMRCYR